MSPARAFEPEIARAAQIIAQISWMFPLVKSSLERFRQFTGAPVVSLNLSAETGPVNHLGGRVGTPPQKPSAPASASRLARSAHEHHMN